MDMVISLLVLLYLKHLKEDVPSFLSLLLVPCLFYFASTFIAGHSGRCPIVKRPEGCPAKVSNKCESDVDCKGEEKCCFNPCQKMCVSRRLGTNSFLIHLNVLRYKESLIL